MRNAFGYDLLRAVSRVTIVMAIGGVAAACSSDTTRLSSNPFSETWKSASAADQDPVRTGSIESRSVPPVTRSGIRTEPLPAPSSSSPSFSPAPRQAAATPARTAAGGPGWSTDGGTTITVGQGDTLSSVSSRYGVPASAILSANDMTSSDVRPGRRLVIPVYSATAEQGTQGRVASSSRIDAKRPMPTTTAEAGRRRPGQPVSAARDQKPAQPVKVARAEPIKPVKPVETKPAKVARAPDPAPVAKPAAQPVPAKPAPAAEKPASREPDSTGALPSQQADQQPGFRWPARGRVISAFGGGSSNEGINIAVPDGTPVKAAGDGVVAYAGSEVKGYGNLVLIRHDNGFVSAYAHNGDLDVKRGQKVTRGQTIAKSGQTGNVTSPQIHFEIRKGSTPVDPMRYLASAN